MKIKWIITIFCVNSSLIRKLMVWGISKQYSPGRDLFIIQTYGFSKFWQVLMLTLFLLGMGDQFEPPSPVIFVYLTQTFFIIEMAWLRTLQKCIIYHFFGHFYYITGFCQKKSIFANSQFFFQILKVEHNSFPMMYHLSYLDIKHGI